MQQTTLSTRPLLISVNPIKGVVYKATQLNRPHPKISVMSIHEAQKHEKRESADMTSALRRKRDRHSSAHDPRYPVGAPSTAVPAVVRTYADHDVLAQLSNKDPRVTIEKKKPSSIHRLKDVLKKVFRSKDSTKPTIVCRKDTSVPISNKLLQSGFYCNMDGCNSCSPPVPSTPLNRDPIGRSLMAARQIGPILEDASSFGSGFTISLSASSRAPSILSPASIDLDVFPDFDGVYIEPTPPQLAPIRSSSAFVEKLRDTTVWHAIEDLAADSSSSSEDDVNETQLTTPQISLTPKASNSIAEERHSATSTPSPEVPYAPSTPKVSNENEYWHSARSTPCPHSPGVPYDQREWSFEISSTALRVLRHTGCAAQRRCVRQD